MARPLTAYELVAALHEMAAKLEAQEAGPEAMHPTWVRVIRGERIERPPTPTHKVWLHEIGSSKHRNKSDRKRNKRERWT